jgi:hypothetical protein
MRWHRRIRRERANSLRRVQKATEDADVVPFVGASATRGMMMAMEAADASKGRRGDALIGASAMPAQDG